jgi:hypothetical protein
MMVTEGMGHVNIVGGQGRIPADLTGVSLERWTNAKRRGAHPPQEVKEPPVMAALCALRQPILGRLTPARGGGMPQRLD